jgi:hypothetical protein
VWKVIDSGVGRELNGANSSQVSSMAAWLV